MAHRSLVELAQTARNRKFSSAVTPTATHHSLLHHRGADSDENYVSISGAVNIFVDTRISHSSNESNTDHGVIKWQTKFCRKQYNLHITISTVILFKQWTKKCHSNWALHEKKNTQSLCCCIFCLIWCHRILFIISIDFNSTMQWGLFSGKK